MSELDRFFKWKVGDIVTLRQGSVDIISKRHAKMVIVQRVLVECSGGIQPSYEFSLFGVDGPKRAMLQEVELMDMPPDKEP